VYRSQREVRPLHCALDGIEADGIRTAIRVADRIWVVSAWGARIPVGGRLGCRYVLIEVVDHGLSVAVVGDLDDSQRDDAFNPEARELLMRLCHSLRRLLR